jgi:hypothetical protein
MRARPAARPPRGPPCRLSLGVDFDNTLICYDGVFHRAAVDEGLVPAATPARKEAVRDHLRAAGREDDWTALQGVVYGSRLRQAEPFPGALELLAEAVRAGLDVSIVSHKTRHPYRGPPLDLHAAALDWLEHQGCFDPAGVGLRRDRVHFLLTKEAKLEQVARCGCTHFVDDLPEILLSPLFPAGTARLLFAPAGAPPQAAAGGLTTVTSWATLRALLAPAWPEVA